MNLPCSEAQLERRKELQKQYTFGWYTHPPKLKPRVPPVKSVDYGKIMTEYDGTTIVTRPQIRIKAIRQEVKESCQRLQRIKNGYSLQKTLEKSAIREYEIEEPQVLRMDSPRLNFRKTSKNWVHVYPDVTMEKNTASDIQNEVNMMIHSIHEEDRLRNNHLVSEINRRNRRRQHAITKQYNEIERYGMDECRIRARRDATMSVLKERREEPWWSDFVASLPSDPTTISCLRELTRHDFTVHGVKLACANTAHFTRMKQILEIANDTGQFMPRFKLFEIFQKTEKQNLMGENERIRT